jgi:hypothetical protein
MSEVLPQTINRRIVIAEGVSQHVEQRHLVLTPRSAVWPGAF